MRGREGVVIAAAGVTLLAAAFLLYQAFVSRMERGDVYPAYSTFRADPKGLRLFHDALKQLPGVEVERNTQSIVTLTRGSDTTLFFAGAEVGPDPQEILAALDSFAATGGRIVIAFQDALGMGRINEADFSTAGEGEKEDMEEESPSEEKEATATATRGDDAPADDTDEAGKEKEMADFEDISERWGFDYHYAPFDFTYPLVKAVRRLEDTALPESVPWLNHTQFQDADERWTTIYAVDDRPVIITRRLGRGSIVLCSDSFFLSNEALREHDVTGLLSWLVGPNRRVIFDESHLGVSDQEHLVRIAGELHLQGVIVLLLVLACLFVWQQTYTLVPRRDPREEDDLIAGENGRDASLALISMLRRGVSKDRLLRTCFQEWRTSRGPGAMPKEGTSAFEQMRRLAGDFSGEGRVADVAGGYERIRALLREARRNGGTGKD